MGLIELEASDNAIVWRWDRDPFGAAAPDSNPNGLGTFVSNLRMPGQYFDSETGFAYNSFRDYDPATGRYVESDPIGLYGGINTYTYAFGDPAEFDDPLGLYIARIPYSSESYKGTGAYVCQYYRANATAGPWGAARNARDADPGNLDKRNAEHYWCAQNLRSEYGGGFWGDTVAVLGVLVHQASKVARAIPFVPSPTTPPSWQNFAWGITGALNPVPPNCGCGK